MSAGYLIFGPLVTRGVGKALNRVVIPQEGKKQSWLAWGLSALLPLIIFLALSWGRPPRARPTRCRCWRRL